jgi:hypothetical protein
MGGTGLVDIARGEMVESELDAMIRRRDTERRKSEGERREEEMYAESVRRYNERQRQQLWWERLRFSEQMVASHTATFRAIIARHEEDAARCRHALGLAPLQENGHKESA